MYLIVFIVNILLTICYFSEKNKNQKNDVIKNLYKYTSLKRFIFSIWAILLVFIFIMPEKAELFIIIYIS